MIKNKKINKKYTALYVKNNTLVDAALKSQTCAPICVKPSTNDAKKLMIPIK